MNQAFKMSVLQRWILIGGLIGVAVTSAFPPWIHTIYVTGTRDSSGVRSEKPAGHHFVLAPPSPEKNAPAFGSTIDFKTLGVELISIAAVTAAILLASQMLRRGDSPSEGKR